MEMVNIAAPSRHPAFSATAVALRAVTVLRRWMSVARQRAALATLDDRLLADIGVSRAAAEAEATRPFWDVAR
jgi:Uncharacterized conserved small protein